MRYVFGLMCVLAGLVASPQSMSAQAAEEGTTEEQSVQDAAPSSEPVPEEPAPLSESASEEPVPQSEPAPEEPALQLKLDDAGVEVASRPSQTFNGYTLEEMKLRVKRAKIGLGVSAAVTVAGVVPLVLGYRGDSCYAACASCAEPGEPQSCNRMRIVGWTVTGLGGVSMIATGILLGARTAELRSLAADYTPGELELRAKRAKIGLGVSGGVLLAGSVMGFVLLGEAADIDISEPPPGPIEPLAATAAALVGGGILGTVTAGVMLRVRKRQLRGLQGKLHHGTPRRVQWDLARSRLVF
jgi:hypothetical protein